jgi:hypothetical protein
MKPWRGGKEMEPNSIIPPSLGVPSPFPSEFAYTTVSLLAPTYYNPENGGSQFLRTVGIHLYDKMVSQAITTDYQ